MSEYLQELDALQRWIKAAAGLNSVRLQAAPPAIARPVILWEAPRRGKVRDLSRYRYTNAVQQYGKLYAVNLEQLLQIETTLLQDLEEKGGVLPIYGPGGVEVGKLQAVTIEFTESENMDVPFRVLYEATYKRSVQPEEETAPPATRVVTKVTTPSGSQVIIES